MFSITQSIQLKRDTASWKRVPQNAARIHTPHPQYLRMMATLKNIVTINLRPPHTISKRETKNMKGPITLYKGMDLIPMMSVI
jgi:hypothetical protein